MNKRNIYIFIFKSEELWSAYTQTLREKMETWDEKAYEHAARDVSHIKVC